MFSQVFICLAGDLYLGGISVQGDLCPVRSLSWRRLCPGGVSVLEGVSVQGRGSLSTLSWRGLCPGGVSVLEGSLSWRGLCPGEGVSVQGRGSLSRGGGLCQGVSVQGGLCLGGLCQETPHTVTCGRYASYWNAFFLSHVFHFIIKLI